MSLTIEIAVESDVWSEAANIEAVVEAAILAAARLAGRQLAQGAEISVLLCDDSAMRTLNTQWRGIEKPTNVLSFPAVDPQDLMDAPILGDIAIAFETAAHEAVDEHKPFADHVAHLAVHGALHLFGYDHIDAGEADAMEALEARILAELGIADPYAGAAPPVEAIR